MFICMLPSEKGGRELLFYAYFNASVGSKLEVRGFSSIFWVCSNALNSWGCHMPCLRWGQSI